VANDVTLVQQEQEGRAAKDELHRKFLVEEAKQRRLEKSKSTRLAKDTHEEGKKELLRYKIIDNDSEGDCIEGLGNTTIDRRGNIGAGDSSDEANQGLDNKQGGGVM